ncbi:hypothetical protein BGX38DRAFT_1268345 [Terfezia claveryi]|nr:hypothetical protein BGX38DRAFT_1268345 [Terfezia claveryi]
MAANQKLGVPMISVITSPAVTAQEHDSLSISPAVSPNTLRPRPDPSSYLSTHLVPPSPTASSYTGRDRSISIGGSTINQTSSTFVARTNEDDNPFTPDPGQEKLFQQDNNPFAFTCGHLIKFFNPKSLAAYFASGGLEGLERGLQTDLVNGLSDREEEVTRKVSFGEATVHVPKREQFHFRKDSSVSYASTLPVSPIPFITKDGKPSEPAVTKKGKSIWDLAWDAYKDPFILVLTGAAIISLALGIYETVSAKQHDPTGLTPIDWVEGVAIVVAIVIVVVVSAGNDWQKERQFAKLNAKKEDRHIQVVRSGKTQDISVYDLLVGDVVCINQGDLIPTDGIIIESNEVKCDESSATGESDQMKKTAGQEVYDRIVANEGCTTGLEKLDPFIISGAKVLEGTGRYLVTAVGQNSSFGKIMMDLRHESDKTPLQVKLEGFAGGITKFGLGSALLLLLVLTFKFVAGLPGNDDAATVKASTFLDILIVAVTIIVVAVPEGLPLAVTLALAYATTRMLKDNNLVRVLRACETMGNATTVCSDKTGTLTQNKMTVVAGIVGKNTKFADIDMESENVGTTDKLAPSGTVLAGFSDQVKELFRASVVLNSTATDGEISGEFNGSKTETALLSLIGNYIGIGGPLSAVRAQYSIKQVFPFDSSRKCMGIVVKTPAGYRLLVKGASEILLNNCQSYITDATGDISTDELTVDDKVFFEEVITSYARRSLRTIGLVYKDYSQWPPVGVSILEESKLSALPKVAFEDIFFDMTLFGVVGIQDPLRPGVSEAVHQCHMAGVTVRMVTGDNVETAKAIAKECGIYDKSHTSEYSVMEGPKFRRLPQEEMKIAVQSLRVLARSSPEDKRILVKVLKDQDEIVAVTGDGTNDGPALKMADVGFSMGIAGTEVAKEASSIILMDDNFSSIVKALMWGRAVNDAVQKFLQFQLTVNITAVVLTFVSAVSSSDMKSVLTAVQLLWVNLIMDTFAALALATDAPTPSILNRLPTSRKAGLVSLRMWKMIIGQAILQLGITFMLYFGGARIFNYSTTDEHNQLRTMVFNTFVWMQIFNEFNNRRLDNGFNVFEGIHRNYFFIGINAVMFGGQIAIIFVGGRAFSIVPLNGVQWAICIALAFISCPWAMLIRSIPDSWVEKLWLAMGKPVADVLAMAWNGMVGGCMGMFGRRRKQQDN